jgi:uracil-DNA glycosylase family 4
MSDNLRTFFRSVQRCRLCYGEGNDILVPAPAFIPERVRILVIGEQPHHAGARNGHNGMGDPETGVENLASYLQRAGIERSDVMYVTAVLCVPDDSALRGSRPTATEAKNCSVHLRAIVDRVLPRLIIPLGHTALLALQSAMKEWTELRQFILNYDIGAVLTRGDMAVYPLYLPSASTLKARPDGRQLRDWQKVPLLLESIDRIAPTG